MPTFDTPTPISVTVDLVVGNVHVIAGDRADTVVEVRPSDGSTEAAREAAKARVDFVDGNLTIKLPKRTRAVGWFTKVGSVDVTVELPSGSNLSGHAALGTLRSKGRLGECRFKTAAGDITLDRCDGPLELTTWSGDVRVAEIGSHAAVKSANGNVWIGSVTGALQLGTANGDLTVDRAGSDVSAKTANGSIRIGEVGAGSVVLNTASGDLEVGIAEGTAAWLDLSSWAGKVHNSVETADQPAPTDRTIEVRARTCDGDIVIRRSAPAAATTT